MAALTAARQVSSIGKTCKRYASQKGSTTIYQGGIVMIDANGYANPGATATGSVGVGVARSNSGLGSWTNSGSDGASNVEYDEGIFAFENSASADAIAADDIGKVCYIVDDQTVALTSGTNTRSKAGTVVLVEGGKVYVHMSAETARQSTV